MAEGEILGRLLSIQTEADPDWTFYGDFLYPDAERQRWIQDNRAVLELETQGDSLTAVRPVEHFLYFTDAAERARFAADDARRHVRLCGL